MSQVKPDCYCLGGNRAHYSEAKYQSLQRTYEQARDEAKHLYGECLMLADVLRDAFEVVKTIEGEDSDECDKLQGLRMSIEYALAAYDERRIDTANKPIRRETDTIVRDKSKRRLLIVGLEPGDVITVRPKGTRKSYSVSVESVYMFAARLEGERIRRERKAGKGK